MVLRVTARTREHRVVSEMADEFLYHTVSRNNTWYLWPDNDNYVLLLISLTRRSQSLAETISSTLTKTPKWTPSGIPTKRAVNTISISNIGVNYNCYQLQHIFCLLICLLTKLGEESSSLPARAFSDGLWRFQSQSLDWCRSLWSWCCNFGQQGDDETHLITDPFCCVMNRFQPNTLENANALAQTDSLQESGWFINGGDHAPLYQKWESFFARKVHW